VASVIPPNVAALSASNTDVAGVWRFTGPQPGPSTLITALIHGNEISGAIAAQALIEHVRANPKSLLRGHLTVAFCNLAAFKHFNAEDLHRSRFVHEDMNRIWSLDKLSQPGTSAERQRAAELLPVIEEADFLLDLHSMHDPGDPLLLTGLRQHHIDFTQSLDLPGHIIVDAGHSDGVRLRDYNPKTIALLVECGFHLAPSSIDVAKKSIARFLKVTEQINDLSQTPSWDTEDFADRKAVRVTDAIVAKSLELCFADDWHNMQTIQAKGTLIAVDGDTRFCTPYDDCTLIMPSLKQLRPGVTVVRFATALKTAFQM
jgi:succinylglutamate desuccinylase